MEAKFITLMINLEVCKKTLNNEVHQYNDDEIMQIRDYLYQLATLALKENEREYEYK